MQYEWLYIQFAHKISAHPLEYFSRSRLIFLTFSRMRLVQGSRLTTSILLFFPSFSLLRRYAKYFIFFSLSSTMISSKCSRNNSQSLAKSLSPKICCRNLLFIDFYSLIFLYQGTTYLRYLFLLLENENFYDFSLLRMCWFLGSSRMNLKALRMQYLMSYSLVFFSFLNLSIRTSLTLLLLSVLNREVKLYARSTVCENQTRQLIIYLSSNTSTQAMSRQVPSPSLTPLPHPKRTICRSVGFKYHQRRGISVTHCWQANRPKDWYRQRRCCLPRIVRGSGRAWGVVAYFDARIIPTNLPSY